MIDASLLPEGGSTQDFRDPKIWRDGDSYYAVIGNRCADGSVLVDVEKYDLLVE